MSKCFCFFLHSIYGQKQRKMSELYKASCNGNLESVKRLLNTLSLDEINRIETNGSTALHASCHYVHLDIVCALLERDACRRQLNKNNKTPEDESCNEQIQALFERSLNASNERFVSKMPDLKWVITGSEGFPIPCDNIYLSKSMVWTNQWLSMGTNHLESFVPIEKI